VRFNFLCVSLLLAAASLVAQAPQIGAGCPSSPGPACGIVNAASFQFNFNLARGEIISIFGTNLSTATTSVDRLPVPTQLPGNPTQVLFSVDNQTATIAGPLFFVSPTQINVQIPYELAPGASFANLQVKVTNGTATSNTVTLNLLSSDAAVFSVSQTGAGPGAILHPDGRLVSPSAPVVPGGVLIIFGTGMGEVNPKVTSGQAAPTAEPLARVTTVPTVTVGGKSATVEFAGLAPGFVGLYQVNVRVPSDLTEPTPDVIVRQGTRTAPTVSAGGPGLVTITPMTIATGADTVALSATGVNLSANASLNFGGRRLTSTVTPGAARQTIAATVPATALRVPGTIPMFVTSPETGTTQSNAVNFTITGAKIAGAAPTISDVAVSGPSGSISGVLGSQITYSVNLTFQDSDGDIVYNGTLQNSARVEIELTGGCTIQATGPTLNYPDQTSAAMQFRATFTGRTLIAGGSTSGLFVNVSLLDQAGNRSAKVQTVLASSFFVCP